MCAAAAASGSVALMHIVGITPEARTLEDAFRGNTPEENIVITEESLKDIRSKMTQHEGAELDFVALGCPHYSINEMIRVRDLLNGRKVHKNITMWIFANSYAIKLAEQMGLRKELERYHHPCGNLHDYFAAVRVGLQNDYDRFRQMHTLCSYGM